MARPGTYLFQRKGSRNWHLRLQYPDDGMRQAAHYLFGVMPPRKIEKSLGTPDRAEAELIAGPEILQHRRAVIAYQAMRDPARYQGRLTHEPVHQPGSTLRNDDGSMIIATKDQIIHVSANGEHTISPNTTSPVFRLDMSKVNPVQRRALQELEQRIEKPPVRVQPKPKTDVDKEIVENWIAERNPAKTHANAARNMLALFQEMFPDKTFATADRDDARAMTKRLEELGNVSATVKSKLSGLVAAVNLEMARKAPRVTFNPFAGVATKKADDTTKRMSLTEADVKAIEARRDLFTDEQWLMWKWCVNTGMRPAEVYNIKEEFRETLEHHPITGEPSDIRFVWVDRSKNLASTRKIAIPSDVLPLIPKEIKGPMFTESLGELCRLINVVIQKAGVTSVDPDTGGERKVFYSCRHRVRDRLENAGCPETLAKAIMGHSKGVHGTYGDGQPLWKIKPWIEYLNHTHKKPPTVTEALAVK